MTLISILKKRAQEHPHRAFLKVKVDGQYHDISWAEFFQSVKLTSLGLIKLGLKPKDRVAILSENRPEWAYADLATISAGGITVPIYSTDSARDVQHILHDSGAKYIIVSNYEQLEKVLAISKKTKLKKVILLEKREVTDPIVLGYGKLLDMGNVLNSQGKDLYEVRSNATRPDDLITIIYTSGSTGAPKGVMLTHNNFISNCKSAAELIKITGEDIYLSFLPLSHVFERMAGYYMFLMQGGVIAYAENRATVIQDMREISPTMVCGVPRFFEKLYTKILDSVITGPTMKKNLFFLGHDVGRLYNQIKYSKGKTPLYLEIQKQLFTKPISKKLKKLLGGRLRFFVSGGAPLSTDIAKFFLAFDILILEGYGLTESSPVISTNSPVAFKIGTVGRPLPEVIVKIASDGEIMVRGPNVMQGYYNRPRDTQTILKDGWLHTGDIGYLDEDDFLVITDRKKDIIVTSGGKNISPLVIETKIKADRYISDVMVYGEGRKYLTALIIPDLENLSKYADYKKISFDDTSELLRMEKIISFIWRRINKRQKDLPRYAQIKKFVFLDKELTQAQGELTPTLKIKRKIVTDKYKHLLDRLYEE